MQHDAGQLALIEEIVNGKGHFAGMARAGTGKSTTIAAGINKSKVGRILYLAFNRDVVAHMRGKLPSYVRIDTFHGWALRNMEKAYPGIEVKPSRHKQLIHKMTRGWMAKQRKAGRYRR